MEELPPGSKKAFTVKHLPIVLMRSRKGEFHAIYGLCPHQRAPLSEGVLGGLPCAAQPGGPFQYEREGEILRCPWHSFSYDVTTGVCLTAPDRLRVKTYPLVIEQGKVFLEM